MRRRVVVRSLRPHGHDEWLPVQGLRAVLVRRGGPRGVRGPGVVVTEPDARWDQSRRPVAFFNEKTDVIVDDERQERPTTQFSQRTRATRAACVPCPRPER